MSVDIVLPTRTCCVEACCLRLLVVMLGPVITVGPQPQQRLTLSPILYLLPVISDNKGKHGATTRDQTGKDDNEFVLKKEKLSCLVKLWVEKH